MEQGIPYPLEASNTTTGTILAQVVILILNSELRFFGTRCIRTIFKFFVWCNANEIPLNITFHRHSSVIALYLHSESEKSCSSSTIAVAGAALKQLHVFCPETNPNPLNTDFCKHVIDAAKQIVNQSVLKKDP